MFNGIDEAWIRPPTGSAQANDIRDIGDVTGFAKRVLSKLT